jgi:hypothetical protein
VILGLKQAGPSLLFRRRNLRRFDIAPRTGGYGLSLDLANDDVRPGGRHRLRSGCFLKTARRTVCSGFARAAIQRTRVSKNWRWRQSSANLSPPRIPCFAGKYREILPLEAGVGDPALALVNKFKAFPSNSLRIETGNIEQGIARNVTRKHVSRPANSRKRNPGGCSLNRRCAPCPSVRRYAPSGRTCP